MSRRWGEWARFARWRAGLAVLVVGLLVVGVSGFAAPAMAAPVPADAWWYNEYRMPEVWRLSQGAGVTVAVVDTGVQANIGDLAGQVLPGIDLTGSGGDGRQDTGAPGEAGFGHGTDMATLIAGSGSGAGLKGIAPRAKILPIRMPDHGDSAVTGQGIRWAVNHGARIINLSFGAPGLCDTFEQTAVSYAVSHDVVVVAATGDDGSDQVAEPANCVGVIAVGGIEPDFSPWSGSTYGSTVDFVAPADRLPWESVHGSLGADSSGTSQAAAFVSGIFALVRSKFPKESARQIVTQVLWTLHNGLGPGHFATRVNDHIGYGEPLPYFALTVNPPANAANPIYDKIDAYLKAQAPPPSSSSHAPATGVVRVSSSKKGVDPIPVWVWGLIAVVVAAIIGWLAVLDRRSRRLRRGSPPSG